MPDVVSLSISLSVTYSSAIASFNIGNSPIERSTGDITVPGSATSYLRQRVLSHSLAFGAFTMPSAIYVGLCTTAPTASVGGSEIPTAGTGYARQHPVFALSAGRTDLAVNTATVEYPPATTNWGAIGYFELWDAATAGNRLYWGPLVDPTDGVTPIIRNINAGDILRLTVNQLSVQAI